MRDSTPLIDHLTGVGRGPRRVAAGPAARAAPDPRGGTSLVVVTGEIDQADLPYLGALRRRFDRLVLISIDSERRGRPCVPGCG